MDYLGCTLFFGWVERDSFFPIVLVPVKEEASKNLPAVSDRLAHLFLVVCQTLSLHHQFSFQFLSIVASCMRGVRMLVGALDSGTSSTRFVLYTSELEVVASAVRKAVTVHGEDGQQEQSAGQMLEMADQCMAEALESAGVGRESVATIGVANQRETAVVWDRRSGEALHAALLWSDQRSELSGLVGRAEEVEQETGLPLAAYFTGGKFAWLLAHGGREMQQVYEQGQLMGGTVDAWLLRHLTGSPSTEPSNASRTLLFSLAQHAYAPSMIARLGLDKLHLPVILPSLSPLRLIRPGHILQGVSIGAGKQKKRRKKERKEESDRERLLVLGDQQAALVGAGGDERTVKATFGTGAFVLQRTEGRPPADGSGLVATVALSEMTAGEERVLYAREGAVAAAGSAVEWLQRTGLLVSVAALDDHRSEGCGSVRVVPGHAGLLAPHWQPQARGCILGLTLSSSQHHIAQATLRGVAHATTDVLEALQETEEKCNFKGEVRCDGGLSRSLSLRQALADVSGREVWTRGDGESTARGVAAAALVGAGLKSWAQVTPLLDLGWTVTRPLLSETLRLAQRAQWRQDLANATN